MSEEITKIKVNMMELKTKLSSTNDTVVRIEKKMDDFIKCANKKFVNREEFKPIKKIVYGTVAFILIAFLSAIVGLVIL